VQAALLAVLGVLDDAGWADALPALAALMGGGADRPPAARLAAVRALPTASPRGALLQQRAAAALAGDLLQVWYDQGRVREGYSGGVGRKGSDNSPSVSLHHSLGRVRFAVPPLTGRRRRSPHSHSARPTGAHLAASAPRHLRRVRAQGGARRQRTPQQQMLAAEALDVPACFAALPWFAGGAASARRLAREATEGGGVGELRAAVAAADILMWPFVLEHGEQHGSKWAFAQGHTRPSDVGPCVRAR